MRAYGCYGPAPILVRGPRLSLPRKLPSSAKTSSGAFWPEAARWRRPRARRQPSCACSPFRSQGRPVAERDRSSLVVGRRSPPPGAILTRAGGQLVIEAYRQRVPDCIRRAFGKPPGRRACYRSGLLPPVEQDRMRSPAGSLPAREAIPRRATLGQDRARAAAGSLLTREGTARRVVLAALIQ